ncbi:hypothetical protein [uncultured Ruegeria sp.]|uniref:hypothetical protein n=1 Tax=uncultured Ruegeria sp. TaxID=259304 RepID=UPI002602FC04|nr:hypothetical protein [uncultured Ruegeria sp.]
MNNDTDNSAVVRWALCGVFLLTCTVIGSMYFAKQKSFAGDKSDAFQSRVMSALPNPGDWMHLSDAYDTEWEKVCVFEDMYAVLSDNDLSEILGISGRPILLAERPHIHGSNWSIVFFKEPNEVTSFNYKFKDFPLSRIDLDPDHVACVERQEAILRRDPPFGVNKESYFTFSKAER